MDTNVEIRRAFGNLEGVETVSEILDSVMAQVHKHPTFRAAVREWGKNQGDVVSGDAVNLIPFGNPGKCREILLVFSLGKAQFDRRLLEARKHCATVCPGTTRGVLFVTDYWDNETFWDTRANAFKRLSGKYGLVFAIGIWSGKSIEIATIIP